MKRLLAVGLLSLYTLSIIHPDELMKIPILVNHFRLHKLIDPCMTFWSFVCDHYSMGDFHDADYEEDMKLPFKIPQHCISNFAAIGPHLPKEIQPLFLEKISSKVLIIRNISTGSALITNSIWQPPKSWS